MEVILIESTAFELLKTEMQKQIQSAVEKAIKSMKPDGILDDWVEFEEAKTIIPYRSKTKWQELRDQGKIAFFQDGRKIKYSRKSLLSYLKKNTNHEF